MRYSKVLAYQFNVYCSSHETKYNFINLDANAFILKCNGVFPKISKLKGKEGDKTCFQFSDVDGYIFSSNVSAKSVMRRLIS